MLKCSEKNRQWDRIKEASHVRDCTRKPDVWRTTRVVLQPKRVGGVYGV
jgi:hypothetical protein